MLGRQNAQLSLSFGVNDIDGTIDDTTKIYSMAGSEEQNPSMTTTELVTLIRQAKRKPIERDTLYGIIRDYSHADPDPMQAEQSLNWDCGSFATSVVITISLFTEILVPKGMAL